MLERTSFFDLRFADAIAIDAPAEAAWAFFEAMGENYTTWHRDHLRFEWRKGRGLSVGNVFYFEERIAGKLQRKTVVITKVRPARYFEFQPTNRVFRFFMPRLSFAFEPDGAGHRFRAEIDLHGIGPIGARLNRREFDAVSLHMSEEGRNLKALLEAAPERQRDGVQLRR